MVGEVREWLLGLRKSDRDTARLVGQALQALVEEGPGLGRPLVDRIKGSSMHNLKELRPGSGGTSEIRVLFVFDPDRNAVLLVAGNKSGRWREWYSRSIPRGRGALRRPVGTLGSTAEGHVEVTTFPWDEVKNEVFDAEDLEEIERGAQRMVAAARAHRLVEMRKQLGLTQSEIADRMHVRQERVSAIERGRTTATEVGTIAAYIAALGGQLEIVANFNGSRVVIV
ncbi:type II toxin-antitoxin system RelE/ParE family toxin [Streptomyces sp. NPDC014685]|uniref:type II toxin-antitoxin system RelE/ParE family toxin n=1 Tax=Streptomyces sp. NPDC014685 TaxID=3364881 RepID=UPI0036FDA9A5